MKYYILFFFFPFLSFSQTLYDPQQLYDAPGGFFDENIIRDIFLEFNDPLYHSYLVNAWFYNPDERIPVSLTLDAIILGEDNLVVSLISTDWNP